MKMQLVTCYITLMVLGSCLTLACIQKAWTVAAGVLFITILEAFLTRKIYKFTQK